MTPGRRIVLSILLCAGAVVPTLAHARGCADFDIQESQASAAPYNPFSPGDYVRNFTIAVRKLSTDANNLRFVLVDEDPRGSFPGFDSHGPAVYDVQWLQDTGRRILGVGQQFIDRSNSVGVLLPEHLGQTANVNFRLVIPRGQVSAPGEHRQPLTVHFTCYNDNDQVGAEYEQNDSRVALTLSTRRFVSAYVGNIGQTSGHIDFGEISATSGSLTRDVAVTALGTAPYDVKFESENDGKIVRETDGEGRRNRSAIGYSMRFGGLPVSSGQKVACPVPAVPAGSTSDLEVALHQDDVSNAPVGNYRDTITLTFQPRDSVWRDGCAVVSGPEH